MTEKKKEEEERGALEGFDLFEPGFGLKEGPVRTVLEGGAIMNPVTGCPITGLVAGASAVIDKLTGGGD